VSAAPLEIRVFGGVEVRGAAGRRLRSRLRQALLATLLVHRGEVVSAGKLAAAVWPDGPPPKWGKGLQVHVHRLRQVLGDPAAVRHHPSGYRLVVPGESVDGYRFEELGRQAEVALGRGNPAGAVGLLRQALALYRGPAFQGLDHVPDLAAESDRLAELRLVALERRFAAELALGEHAGLVPELAATVAEHPLREHFRAQLMTALYRAGRKADALAAYRAGRQILVAELGVEPSPECRALERAILTDDPALLAGLAGASAGRAGAAAGGPPGRPAPAPPVPRQLPPDVAGFAGRVAELAWLDDRLAGAGPERDGGAVLAVVDGMAGVGKTALAVHWAHRGAGRFPDGQLYLDLRGYSAGQPVRPDEAVTWFLRALEGEPDRLPPELDEAVARYRSLLADRQVLVVLDNAHSADQVRPLLPGGGACRVLVTSRHQLPGLVARDGAHRLDLDVLPPVEAVGLLATLLGPARVAAEPAAVTELAELCGRLPLALRVAAAGLVTHPALPVARSVARLRDTDRLASLAVPDDQPATVAAAFADTYRRLAEPERRMFQWVGLLPGPDTTPEAAAAVAAVTVPEAADQLQKLAGTHLLEERPAGRYAGHDLLREFAARQAEAELPPAGRAVGLGRWYDFHLARTGAAVARLFPGVLAIPRPLAPERQPGPEPFPGLPDPAAAMAWLQVERENLIAAVRHAAANGPFPAAWQLADALHGFLAACGYPADALSVAQAGLAAAESARDTRAQAGMVLAIAQLHFRASRYRLAAAAAARCRRLLRDTDWPAGQAGLRSLLGSLCGNSGQPDRAIGHLRAALKLFERSGSRHGQAAVISNLSVLLYQQGQLPAAAEYAHRAERAFAALGSRLGQGDALTDLGGIYHVWGELDRAREHYTRARDCYRSARASREADALLGLAQVELDAGRSGPARELAEAAVAQVRSAGDRRLEPESLIVLASVYDRLRRRRAAIDTYQQALALARASDNQGREALALVGLAAMRPPPDGFEAARERAGRALAIASEWELRLVTGQVLTRLAEIELAGGSLPLAVRYAEAALASHREAGCRLEQARTELVLGNAGRAAGDPVAAEEHWHRAYAIFAAVGAPEARRVAALLAGRNGATGSARRPGFRPAT